MKMKIKFNNQQIALCYGAFCGGYIVFVLEEYRRHKIVTRINEHLTLVTEALNWIANEGVYLEEEEFYAQCQEKFRFINIVIRTRTEEE